MIEIKIKIKNCPFCDGNKTEILHSMKNHVAVVCKGCGAKGPYHDNEQLAIQFWNRRPIEFKFGFTLDTLQKIISKQQNEYS